MGLVSEFKEFAIKGNAVDLAVGIVIGAAFTGIVNSLVNDVVMPPLGVLTGDVDFTRLAITLKMASTTYDAAGKAVEHPAVLLNYGKFINTLVQFLIVASTIFFLVKGMNHLRRPPPKPVEGSGAPSKS